MAELLSRSLCLAVFLSLFVIFFKAFPVKAICQATDSNIPRLFATKTAYEAVRGTEVKEEVVPGCKVIHHYILSRHGTRYDDAEDIAEAKVILEKLKDQVIRAHEQGKGELCSSDLESLRAWTMRMETDGGDENLAEEGWRELREHAQRDKIRFPSLLARDYAAEDFKFRHTQALGNHRTRDSARAYAEGLFGIGKFDGIYMKEYPNEEDNLLKFYDTCDKYIQTVDDVPNVERDTFEKGPEAQGVVQDVTRRLGLEEGTLDFDTIDTVFFMAAYDLGIYGDTPWISAFSYEDSQIINYYEDLKYYWEDAYAHQVNYQMPCKLLVDVNEQFESAMYTGKPVSVNRFGHSSTSNGMVALLGLFRDAEHLKHDNFNPDKPKVWNTSLIAPMSASIQLALYECDDREYRIKTFVNEKPVVLPACSSDVCLLKDVMASWKPIINSCNFPQICKMEDLQENPDDSGTGTIHNTFLLLNRPLFLCLVFCKSLFEIVTRF